MSYFEQKLQWINKEIVKYDPYIRKKNSNTKCLRAKQMTDSTKKSLQTVIVNMVIAKGKHVLKSRGMYDTTFHH